MVDKYIWLIETLRRGNGLTLAEIDNRWRSCSLNESGRPFNRRTLLRWRESILELFNISIHCDQYDGYRYKLNNDEDEREKYLRWLINMHTTDNILSEYKSISRYVMLEEYYSGAEHLKTILQAIKDRKSLSVVYHNFRNAAANPPVIVCPLCVRLFDKRWYVLAMFSGSKGNRNIIMAMDRITTIETMEETFKIPDNFNPQTFFNDFYGIYVDNNLPTKRVVIRVPESQLPYLKTLPLHHSQNIVEHAAGCYLVEYYLKITPDLAWAVLDRLRNCQVLEPPELKDELLKITNSIIQTQNHNI